MNTYKLYIASLRIVTKCESIGVWDDEITHSHLKYVLVRSNNRMCWFRDVQTRQIYRNGFDGLFGIRNVAIVPSKLIPFNEVTGNTQKHMSKRKALTLFSEVNNRIKKMEE